MDGVLIDLLNAKWNTFVKFKFYRQFFTFAFYFLISLVAFTLRPGPPVNNAKVANNTNATVPHAANHTNLKNISVETVNLLNNTHIPTTLKSLLENDNDDEYDVEEWWDNLQEECRLMQLETPEAKIRLAAEIAITVGAFLYLAAAIREARFLGTRMFFENLVSKNYFTVFYSLTKKNL